MTENPILEAAERRTQDELLLEALLERARRAGAEEADALLVRSRSLDAEVRLGALESLERSESFGLGLRVLIGRRQAFVSTSSTASDVLDELVERALSMARIAPEDPHAGLAPAERLAEETDATTLELFDPTTLAEDRLKEMALATEEAARAVAGVTNSGGASASWGEGMRMLATSHGFFGCERASHFALAVSVMAQADDERQRDYEAVTTRFLEDLPAPEEIGRQAGERTVRRLGARQIDTDRLPIVFEPRVARSLAGHFAAAIDGEAVARGTSFLKDSMGERVFAPAIRILDDPHRRRGLRSRSFDAEGVATRPIELVKEGVLRSWLLDCASARRLGLASTGHAARGLSGPPSPAASNLCIAPGERDRESLIGEIERGLLVHELIGQGVNPVTGDYSRGASGFWIEKGEILFPVQEITIAGNLKDMFARMEAADDLVFRYGIDAPTLRIDGMTVAGR